MPQTAPTTTVRATPVSARLPESLLLRIDQSAAERGLSRSERLLQLIQRGLEAESIDRLVNAAIHHIEAAAPPPVEAIDLLADKLDTLVEEVAAIRAAVEFAQGA